ncbi:MAG TPA: YqcI/YcgG family protein [Afifellaceae bacterium]|nr:YqcI/YcgG family protein [Afifellaceae bacterium]
MERLHFDKMETLQAHGEGTWQRLVFNELAATLTSEARPFPCVFGVNGFRTNQLRFAFLDPLDAGHLAPILRAYLAEARSYGPNTSLVVFSRPGAVGSIESYHTRFWSLLNGLASIDRTAWPEDIPQELDHPHWEFCFAGEPVFVVCNTPAHVLRQSRRASIFMLTFQPRWVFDRILGSPKAAESAFEKVRDRLRPYDFLAPSPVLGRYGEKANREFEQYFIGETNEKPKCPFAKLGQGLKRVHTAPALQPMLQQEEKAA